MRIAYLCADNGVPVLGNKGASVHVREFTDALVGLGHEVRIYATSALSGGAPNSNGNTTRAPLTVLAPSEQTRMGARTVAASLGALNSQPDRKHLFSEVLQVLSDPELVRAAEPLLRDWVPDLVIARHTLFSAAGLTLARSLGCPLVLEVNAPLIEERRRYWGLTLDRAAQEKEQMVFGGADLLVAVSEGVRAYLLRCGAPRERIMVQPNGVNLSIFHPEIDDSVVRDRYNLQNRLVVGFAGSLKPWHGVDMLLRAFASVSRVLLLQGEAGELPLHLLIVGEGPQHEHLAQLAGELEIRDAVTFTGAVPHDDVSGYLAAMDIAVAPYLPTDGFYFSPLKVMEYLAMGRAIVAPRLGQIPSLLQGSDGPCGLIYSPDDQHELAAALLRLSREPELRRLFGLRAAAQARRRASWRTIAQQIVERSLSADRFILERETCAR